MGYLSLFRQSFACSLSEPGPVTASDYPPNQVSDRRAPWWAWVGPACAFVFFLALFWPRPYALPAGDGLAYYSGARHIAAEGRYYDDYSQRP